MQTAAAHRARKTGFWGHFPVLLAMLAIAVQTLVVQPHIHPPRIVDEAAFSTLSEDSAGGALVCATCRLSASARVFMAPPPLLVAPPNLPALTHAAFVFIQTVATTPRHTWRSRAPPISLR